MFKMQLSCNEWVKLDAGLNYKLIHFILIPLLQHGLEAAVFLLKAALMATKHH